MIKSEGDFQRYVTGLLAGMGHLQDHRFSSQPHIPDLSLAAGGRDYWLELKYDKFHLGHSRYDDFRWTEEKAGQLEWLSQRQMNGQSVCGLLGFMDTGDNSQFICFMPPDAYKVWKGRNVGGVILTDYCMEPPRTGVGLLAFLQTAARCQRRPHPRS